jgi:plasmid stabilization system protein ParE
MAQDNPRRAKVTVSVDAVIDLTLIYIQTTETWDQEQAERYNEFLLGAFDKIAEMPFLGRPISDRPGLISYVAKWKRAKHGHRIVYRRADDRIEIVRVLHTAMNWQDHI